VTDAALDPVLTTAATALAGKAATALAEGGRTALAALARLVRDKLSRTPAHAGALAEADAQPEDEGRVRVLAGALERACAADTEFQQRVRDLWDRASLELHADHGGVVNQITGAVGGHVVRARDIQGGINFGGAGRG
jgi:hypothetical protein